MCQPAGWTDGWRDGRLAVCVSICVHGRVPFIWYMRCLRGGMGVGRMEGLFSSITSPLCRCGVCQRERDRERERERERARERGYVCVCVCVYRARRRCLRRCKVCETVPPAPALADPLPSVCVCVCVREREREMYTSYQFVRIYLIT